jgi:WD40 repeat protein
MLLGYSSGLISVFNVKTGDLIHDLNIASKEDESCKVTCLVRAGRYIVAGSANGHVQIFDINNGNKMRNG